MYELIVFLPLLGFLIAGVFGPWIGARGAEYVTTGLLGVSFVLSWIAFIMVAGGADAHVPIGNWFTSGKVVASWALRIDTLTAVMLVVVTTVSFLVHVYSIGYMADDPSPAALLRLPLAVHLRHADAGDGGQSGAALLRLGGRRPHVLPADRVLVRAALGQRRRDQGLRRQPGRRLRVFAGDLPHLSAHRFDRLRSGFRRCAGPCRQDRAFPRHGLGRGDAGLPAPVHGRNGQVGAVPAAHLAP